MDAETKKYLDELHVEREAIEKLHLYHDLLLKWQSKINLISRETVNDVWRRHILDSLQLLKWLPNRSATIMDIGTGAGFPGMVLAITGCLNVHLVESDGKKISFLREVSRVAESPATIHHQRMETLPDTIPDIMVSRACSDLTTLLEYSSPYFSHEIICLFHKGKNWANEVEDAKKKFEFEASIFPSISDPSGVILQLQKLRR